GMRRRSKTRIINRGSHNPIPRGKRSRKIMGKAMTRMEQTPLATPILTTGINLDTFKRGNEESSLPPSFLGLSGFILHSCPRVAATFQQVASLLRKTGGWKSLRYIIKRTCALLFWNLLRGLWEK